MGRRGKEDPSVAARPLPGWVTMVPLSASRRADSFLTEDEEKAKKGSDQVVDSGGSSVDGRPPGPGRDQGVSSPAQALQEPPPFRGLLGSTQAAHLSPQTGT